jgi:DNA end-binding protein Ku
MARPTWKGFLGFGLVQLPVELHPATQEDDLDFTMLDQRNMSPIGYQRVNKKTHKEVPWKEIVKGFEVSKGHYVVVTPADLKAAHPKATRAIEISDFVDASEVSPVRWSSSYFVAPDPKASPKPYVVLREALRRTGKIGIAKVVIRTRQHLCAVTVEEDAIMLAMLRFDDELRDANDLELPKKIEDVKATKKELDLAEQLITTMSGPWDPSQYRDEYQDALRAFIAKKVKRGDVGEVPAEEEAEEAVDAKTFDLVTALKASLGEKPAHANGARRTARTGRRAASSKRKAAPKRAARPRPATRSRAHS